MTGHPLREEDLHAFIDGELDEAGASAVAQALAADPALAARAEAYLADKAMLAAHFGPLIDRPVPEAWTRMVAGPSNVVAPRRFQGWSRPLLALAASVLLLIAGLAGYRTLQQAPGEQAVAAAMSAHDGAKGEQIAADAGQISAVLGQPLKLPDLSKAGYTLAEVAVYPGAKGKAVKIAYRNSAGEPFTLYLQASAGSEAFDITKHGDLLVCLWQDDVLSTVMVGKMSAAEMLRVASLAYNGLYF